MPEPGGLAIGTALTTVARLAAAIPVAGFGATGVTLSNGDADKTAEAIARLVEAALNRASALDDDQPGGDREWRCPRRGRSTIGNQLVILRDRGRTAQLHRSARRAVCRPRSPKAGGSNVLA